MDKKPEFRVIIAGCRDFNDYPLLCEKCDKILGNKRNTHNVIVISGCARGADYLGERYAKERGYQTRLFPADWERDGNSAGPKRNARMAANADALIAFWDGESRGTRNMIDNARSRGLLVRVILPGKKENISMENCKEQQIKEKWGELLDYARQHATGEGFHRGYAWLKDSFNEYLAMSDEVPGYGMGGQSGSQHNRQVLAGRILLELGNGVGGRHLLDEVQETKLKKSLQDIVANPKVGNEIKI